MALNTVQSRGAFRLRSQVSFDGADLGHALEAAASYLPEVSPVFV